jgi:transposase
MTKRSRLVVESPAGSKTEPFFELTDEQWYLIADLFPDTPVGPEGGRPRVASRPCFEGILWMLRSGARWKDLPKHFPSPATCWRRLKVWTEAGLWEKAWAKLLRKLDRQGQIAHDESFADGTFSSAKKGAHAWGRRNEVRAPRPWCSATETGFRWQQPSPVPARQKSR